MKKKPLTPEALKKLLRPPTDDLPEAECYVYVIGDPDVVSEDLCDYLNSKRFTLSNIYVGITRNCHKRWTDNCVRPSRKDNPIVNFIKENGWEKKSNMFVIACGDRDTCNTIEYNLRPLPNMGMNTRAGGTEPWQRGWISPAEMQRIILDFLRKGTEVQLVNH